MNLSAQITKRFREVHFGGNWTWSNLKDQLSDISWEEATTQIYSLNTIVTLTYHINYYVDAVIKVFRGGPLESKDEHSFTHPPINCQEDWDKLRAKVFTDAEKFADLLEKLPEKIYEEDFTDKKYGDYYRNIHGIIEHTHYHLGQIAILKKIIRQKK